MKKITAIILICILMMVGCGNSDATGNKALDGELNLESNQSLVIAQVTAIYGNEITLALAEKVDNSATNKKKSDETNQNTTDSDTSTNKSDTTSNQDSTSTESKTKITQDSTSTKGDTSNVSTDGAVPSTTDMPTDGVVPSTTDMPSGVVAPNNTNTVLGANDKSNEESTSVESSSSDKTDKKAQTQVTRYTLTGEEMTATIPVGTPVTTLLGTVTTFSRIAVDNTLQIVTETNKDGEDVIVAIYIVG